MSSRLYHRESSSSPRPHLGKDCLLSHSPRLEAYLLYSVLIMSFDWNKGLKLRMKSKKT